MINIDFLTIKAFFLENIDFLIGARVQKIQQPSRTDFIFFLRNNSKSKKLYININPSIYHIAFMSESNEQRRGLLIPKQPHMFCMLLRKYLEGCRISDAKVIDNERILELHFETYDEFANHRSLCLAVELMGKHSNVILYDRDTFVVIGCAHNVSAEKSRYRELKGGLKYIYPPKTENLALSNELKHQFENLAEDKIQYYLSAENFRPAIFGEKYTLFSELIENSVPQTDVNNMLDNYYACFQEKINLKNAKNKLFIIADSKLKKINKTVSKIELLLKKRENCDKYKLYGELLTANIYLKCDYQNKIKLYDYINNTDVVIELDKTKTMNENAQRYYKLYTKAKNTREKSLKILSGLKTQKDYLENILYSIDTAENMLELAETEAELGIAKTKQKQEIKQEIMKIKISEFDIYIGKNNRQNDYIISKLSKDEDYWFHTKLCAGSHVLLKVNGLEPEESVIYECAKLARKYSSSKQPSKVSVVYTKRKFIRKPPSAPLGYVTYKNEKEVLI